MQAHKKLNAQRVRVFLSLILFTCLGSLAVGQVSLSTIETEASANQRLAGFNSIFFSKSNLEGKLVNANHLSFTSGMTSGFLSRTFVLMAIGTDANGEIGDQFIQASKSKELDPIDRATKDAQVARLGRRMSILASFPKSEIDKMLNEPNVTGINFMPTAASNADGSAAMTLTAVPAGAGGTSLSGMTTMRSPCPTDCPDL